MVLLIQLGVGVVVRALGLGVRSAVGGARGLATGLVEIPVSRGLVAITGTETAGTAAARLLASEIISSRLVDFVFDRLKPGLEEGWDQSAAIQSMELIREVAIQRHMRGPHPRKLRTITGRSAESVEVRLAEGGRGVSVGSVLEHLAKYEDLEHGIWRDRAWLEPAIDDVMPILPDLWAASWEAIAS